MPRPPFTPNDEQLRLLNEAAEDFQRAEQGWAKLARAVELGVPKDVIPNYVQHSRATVLRKLKDTARGKPTTNGRKRR